MTFLEKLLSASRANNSLLCVGLDPDPERMPVSDIAEFNRAIIDATADLVCAYKPNLAFYEAAGIPGLRALEATLEAIPDRIPVIADAKRGDIGNTARAYARSLFDHFDFDAATVSPYLGSDSLEPFLDYADKGVLVLCRTSNPGGADLQEQVVAEGEHAGRRLFEVVAYKCRQWNGAGNVGLVVGATQPEELRRVREVCPDLPILIPGVGPQGGDLAAAVGYGTDAHGERAIISSSRQVLYASKGADFAQAARSAAALLREEINRHRAKPPGGPRA